MQLTRSTELAVGQSVRYLPYYVFSLLPAAAGLDPTDLDPNDRGVSAKGNIGWVGNVSITQRLARRTSLSASAGISNTYFRSEPSLDLRSADASVRLSHGLTRYSSLRLGYGHQEAHYPGPGNGRFVNRSIDAGIAYNRPLSITRRTTASFGFGTNVYEGVQGTVYRAIGNAHLNREICQTWRATVGYTRGLGFIQGVPEPYFSDTAHLSFGGLITNRLESAFGASYSTGELGAVLQKNPFTMYSGTASLRYALSRLLAMNIEYGYYRHDFQENTLLPPGVIAVLGRHTVRAGLSVWVPLLTRTRR
jgi:hypothetical protein